MNTGFIATFFQRGLENVFYTGFRESPLRLSQAQVLLSLGLGALGFLVALYIAKEQIDISNKQLALSKREFEVSGARFQVESFESQLNRVIAQTSFARERIEEKEEGSEEWEELNKLLKSNKIVFDNTNKALSKAIANYNNLLKEPPFDKDTYKVGSPKQ